MEMVDDDRLREKGYVVVRDTFYFSHALFLDLVERGFGTCGIA